MNKLCDVTILDKKENTGRRNPEFRYRYYIKFEDESGWVNSSKNYEINDNAGLFVRTYSSNKYLGFLIK